MKATVLVDNIGTEDLAGEWGLSFFIEFRGKKVLLDAGADGLFAENAGKLGISLNEADYAVLSHAHYDHADGNISESGKDFSNSIKTESSGFPEMWNLKKGCG